MTAKSAKNLNELAYSLGLKDKDSVKETYRKDKSRVENDSALSSLIINLKYGGYPFLLRYGIRGYLSASRMKFQEREKNDHKLELSNTVSNLAKFYESNIYPVLENVKGSWFVARNLRKLNRELVDLPFETSNPKQFEMHLVTEIEFLERFCDEVSSQSVVADVGSYRGIYSFIAGSKGASAHAFEITENNYREIRKTASENPGLDVEINRKAVWSSEEKVEVPETGTGQSQVGKGAEKIDSVTLDNYFSDRKKPDVIKVDVEGAEFEVLKGAEKLLEAEDYFAPTVFLEIHEAVEKFDSSKSAIEEFLQELDYRKVFDQSRRSEAQQIWKQETSPVFKEGGMYS